MRRNIQCWSLFIWLLSLSPLIAQPEAAPVSFNTPYETVRMHLYYLQPESYRPEVAARAFGPMEDRAVAQERAIQLKQILDGKGLWVSLQQVSQDRAFVDTLSGRSTFTLFPKALPEVYVERINQRWYYSRETYDAIPRLYDEMYPLGAEWLVRAMPKFGHRQVLGMPIWQYAGLLLLLGVALLAYLIFALVLRPVLKRLARVEWMPEYLTDSLLGKLARLIGILLSMQVIKLFLPTLQLPVNANGFARAVIKVVSLIVLLLISMRGIDLLTTYLRKFAERTTSRMDEQLIPIIRRMLQVLVVLGALIQLLTLFNINLTALIAGLSIGGLALALAAQDTVKNLLGSATIFIDKPFQIGDYVVGDGFEGSVVEVGFRTTRIRTIDSSIISVPNGSMANMPIKNLGMRSLRLLDAQLGITYGTDPDLIEQFIEGLRRLIEVHPNTQIAGSYVHLHQLNDSSLDIMFRTNILVSDYAQELQSREELLMGVIRLAEVLGVSFAYPTTTINVETLPTEKGPVQASSRQSPAASDKMDVFLENYRQRLNLARQG